MIGGAAVWLIVLSRRSRTVLAALLGSATIALVVFALISGPASGRGERALVYALVALLIGTALYAIGQTLGRLLDEDPEDQG